jgi:hypothetical protein
MADQTVLASPGTSALLTTKAFSREGAAYCFAIATLACLYFLAHDFEPICDWGGDCPGYLALMGRSVFSEEYWIWFEHMFRGYSIPVIYSLFGEVEDSAKLAIVYFQTVVAFLAWISFALAVAGLFVGKLTRWWVFVALASGMFSRTYLHYDTELVSDSLAQSFILGWLALLLAPFPLIGYLGRRLKRYWIAVFLLLFWVLTSFAASARDANIFLIVFGLPVLMLRFWHSREMIYGMSQRRLAILMAVVILSVVLLQWHAASRRNQLNMANIIAGVVLTDPGRLEYFLQRGMPVAVSGIELGEALGKARSLREITDNRPLVLGPFRAVREKVRTLGKDFLRKDARRIYAGYLLTHPGYLAENLVASWSVMFEQGDPGVWDLSAEVPLRRVLARLSAIDIASTRTTLIVSLSALVFLLTLVAATRRDFVLQLGIVLGIAGFLNALIGFHGDLWELSEMGRHAYLGSLFVKLGATIILLRTIVLLDESRKLGKSIGNAIAD